MLPEKKLLYVENAEIQEKIQNAQKALSGRGRVLIRPSGTESLLRVMLEGEDKNQIETLAADIAQTAKKHLG